MIRIEHMNGEAILREENETVLSIKKYEEG
jgi:hypothetical protein